jgi:long-chain acyl-CoA synthetase
MGGGFAFTRGAIAIVDEDGYFFIVDRNKDLIIRGGYDVYPRELKEVLCSHPAVRAAAVIGVPPRVARGRTSAPRWCSGKARTPRRTSSGTT